MTLTNMTARDFWYQLENRHLENDSEYFARNSTSRSSYNGGENNLVLHPPVWGSIYCTLRNRNRGRTRSTSASSQRAVIHQTTFPRSLSQVSREPISSGNRDKTVKKMQEVEVPKKMEETYIPPKRYETTCYFMPLAVPVWYSTSVSIKLNSTKKSYTEAVNYKQKMVPYRYTETMTTVTPNTGKPIIYLSNLSIERQIPVQHYISLEPQQEAAREKSCITNEEIKVENHI